MFAVEFAALDKANLLLQYNVDVSATNTEGETALYLASQIKGHKEIIMALLKNVSSISDENIDKIILNILENYDAEVLDTLILVYPDFDIPITKDNDTPLLYAIKNLLDKDIIDLLIKEGSSMSLVDKNNNTALLAALKVGIYPDVLEKLIELSDVNVEDKQGKTPLMMSRDIKSMRLIVPKTVDINTADFVGNTALIYAVKNTSNLEIIKYLVENGADITSKNKYGETPKSLSKSKEITLYLDTKQ